VDLLQVEVDRLDAEKQCLRSLPVGESGGNHLRNAQLGRAQSIAYSRPRSCVRPPAGVALSRYLLQPRRKRAQPGLAAPTARPITPFGGGRGVAIPVAAQRAREHPLDLLDHESVLGNDVEADGERTAIEAGDTERSRSTGSQQRTGLRPLAGVRMPLNHLASCSFIAA